MKKFCFFLKTQLFDVIIFILEFSLFCLVTVDGTFNETLCRKFYDCNKFKMG